MREFAAREQILALALGEQRTAINHHTNFAVRPGLAQYLKLLVGPCVFPGKAQEFKKKRSASRIGWIVSYFGAQRLERISQPACSI